MRNILLILAITILIGGCSSIGSRVQNGYTSIDKGIYPGVRGDIEYLKANYQGSELQGAEVIIYPLALFDLPIAVLLDTTLLPADLLEQNGKYQKVRELTKKYLPDYEIFPNVKRKELSRFTLVAPNGERISFDKNFSKESEMRYCYINEKLNNFFKERGIYIQTELEAQEVVQLTMMILYGDTDITKETWYYQIDRKEKSWEVSIKNKQGGRLGNIWNLDIDEKNKLVKISDYVGI